MLRSLNSGISGLRSHQTMLDVTGNNIANVNTTGFKSSSVLFQDTLSQMTKQPAGGGANGGTNPAQVGLGVQVASITTNFAQGSAQATGRATDMMIAGEGFFVTAKGGEQLYSRAGAFDLDSQGRMVSPDGAVLQGWAAVNGQVQAGGAPQNLVLSGEMTSPARATTSTSVTGNLPSDAELGTELVRDIDVYDATGNRTALSLTFTRTTAGWDVAGENGGAPVNGQLTFTDGRLTGGGALNVGGINVDLAGVTGYSGMNTVSARTQDGYAAGTLESFSIGTDGTVTGSFSNGAKLTVAQVAMATFDNPAGLEKAGASGYRASINSGLVNIGIAGSDGFGSLASGTLEMSNVDLGQEFTNLIIAQRGFQANSRIITTSDEVLQELTNLKR